MANCSSTWFPNLSLQALNSATTDRVGSESQYGYELVCFAHRGGKTSELPEGSVQTEGPVIGSSV